MVLGQNGVDYGYSRPSAEIRKPQAIRRGAKEGLPHSIICVSVVQIKIKFMVAQR